MAAQHAHGFGERRVIGHRHAAFAGGDDLHRMEAEDGDVTVAAVAGGFTVIESAEGMTGILDDPKAVLLSQAMDLLHVAGQAGEMYRDDHLGQTSLRLGGYQLAFQLHGAHVAGIGLDVDEVDLGSAVECAVGRGDKADGGGPDPVTRADTQRQTGDMQGGRT